MTMIWYNDIGSFFDPNNAISMTEFAGIAFIWKSSKWALMAISSYHSDIIALSKSIAKYAWLSRMINHTQNHVVEIHQNHITWFIKTLPLVLLNTYRLYEEQYHKAHCLKSLILTNYRKWGNNLQTKYCENPTDYSQCHGHVNGIGMTHPLDLQTSGGVISKTITC